MTNKNLLELKNVSVSFEGFLALDELNISLKKEMCIISQNKFPKMCANIIRIIVLYKA